MSQLTEGEVQAFLNDLTALTVKHGIAINGCGHCGSPWLERDTDTDCAYTVTEKAPFGEVLWHTLTFEQEKTEP